MNHQIARCLVTMALLPAMTWAADTPNAEVADSAESIDTVTIIGRRSDANDIPGSAHVLDADALSTFNESDILRVLQSVPGVYIQEEEGFGLRPNIGIRGSGLDRSGRIALLEDGVLIAPAPYAAASAYYFPTQRRMHAIEVLKGPAAVAIGPRTTGGAINMISTPIPEGTAADIDARFGADNTIDAHARLGHGGPRVGWLVETVQASSDGFKTVDGRGDVNTGFDLEDYVAKFRVDSDPGSRIYQGISLKVARARQDANETYLGLTDADFAANPYRRYAASALDNFTSEHEQYQATYVIDPGNRWRGRLTAYRNDFSRNWYKLQSVSGASLAAVLADTERFAEEYGYLTGTTSPADALQIRANKRSYYSTGVQARIEKDLALANIDVMLDAGFRIHRDEEDRFQHQDGYRMENGSLVLTSAGDAGSQTNRVSSASVRALFVNAEIRAGRWIVTPGARFEDIDLERLDFSTTDPTRADGPTRARQQTSRVIIPGLGALYRVNQYWRLLAGVHRGYNPPAPGSSADAEMSVNVEVGTRYDHSSINFEAIYFVNDYENLVGTVTESTGGGGQIGDQFEAGEAIVRGLELSVGATPVLAGLEFPLGLRYTWTAAAEFRNAFESDFEPWGDVERGDSLPYIPEHQLRAMAGIETARARFNLAASYVDRVRTRASQGRFEPETTVGSHVVWDAVGSLKVSRSLTAYLKVANLTDETYAAARRPAGLRPGLPRTAYLGVQWAL